nr:hypothetical protein [Conexibacter sp. W3-3-2]
MVPGDEQAVGLVEEHQVTGAMAGAVQHAKGPIAGVEQIAVGQADADVDRCGELDLRSLPTRERLQLLPAHPVSRHQDAHVRPLALQRDREVREVAD